MFSFERDHRAKQPDLTWCVSLWIYRNQILDLQVKGSSRRPSPRSSTWVLLFHERVLDLAVRQHPHRHAQDSRNTHWPPHDLPWAHCPGMGKLDRRLHGEYLNCKKRLRRNGTHRLLCSTLIQHSSRPWYIDSQSQLTSRRRHQVFSLRPSLSYTWNADNRVLSYTDLRYHCNRVFWQVPNVKDAGIDTDRVIPLNCPIRSVQRLLVKSESDQLL